MGAPVDTGIENFEEVILGLSISDRAKLIGWISGTLIEDDDLSATSPSLSEDTEWPPKEYETQRAASKQPEWMKGVTLAEQRTSEERQATVAELAGRWKHNGAPEEMIKEIYSSRSIDEKDPYANE